MDYNYLEGQFSRGFFFCVMSLGLTFGGAYFRNPMVDSVLSNSIGNLEFLY